VPDTEERLAKLEERLETVERVLADARDKFDAFANSPAAKKLAGMFGVKL
jgi:hypothetical protein